MNYLMSVDTFQPYISVIPMTMKHCFHRHKKDIVGCIYRLLLDSNLYDCIVDCTVCSRN